MHQSGFLAADECARTQADEDIKIKTGAKDVLAQQAIFTGLIDGDFQALDGDGILRAHIDIALAGADGIAADGHGFQHGMRVALQHGTVHKGARVALVGVTDHVFLIRLGGGGKLPLLARGETRAAAAAQAGLEHLADDLFGGHFGEHLGQRSVAVKGDVFIDVFGIDHAAVAQRKAHLGTVKVDVVQRDMLLLISLFLVDQMLHDAALEQVLGNDFIHIIGTDAAVEGAFRVDDHHGARLAQAEAARADHLDLLVQTVFGDLLFKTLDQLGRSARRTACTAADQHMCAKKIHVRSSLAFCSHSPSAAPMVYSCTGRPLTMCSATMRGTMSGFTRT